MAVMSFVYNFPSSAVFPFQIDFDSMHGLRYLTSHRLAWCLTIHKVQGASIDFLDVDLDGCFEFGQVYVALSRARSADGLSVRNFDVRSIKTHEAAKRFHQVALCDACIPSLMLACVSHFSEFMNVIMKRTHASYFLTSTRRCLRASATWGIPKATKGCSSYLSANRRGGTRFESQRTQVGCSCFSEAHISNAGMMMI
jgi:hypothetical protein